MKKIMICLILFPIMVFAQNQKSMEDAMKKLEEAKKNMTPQQIKMMEQMGIEQTMKNVQKNTQQGNGSTGMMMPTGDPNKIPEKITSLKTAAVPANKEQLLAYLKPVFSQTEAAMKPDSKASVKNLLNKSKQTGQYAMVFWSHNELDKALYLLLNACIIDPGDYLSLNNLGTLLTLSGYAHKSLPILLYAQKALPQSPTLLNNVGQAYLSLGYVDKAQSLFAAAVAKDSTQTEAYRSMALIARKQGNNALCGNYLEKAIANGAATAENINLLKQIAPEKDLSESIRRRFKKYYKDHSITKRFIVPKVPASYEEAVERDNEVEAYFRDFDATINATYKTQQELTKKYEGQVKDNMTQKMAQMQQMMANVGKPGFAQSVQDMKASLANPFIAQGAIMLSSIENPQFSKSYTSRLKTESGNRLNSENELKQALKIDFDNKINALEKEKKGLDDGEGKDAANVRAVQIEKELCKLKNERQAKWLEKMADINNQFIHNIEDLLNQRLQEYLFWNTIVMQSMQDPTAINYAAYVRYMKDLQSFARPLFPTHVDGGLSKPCGDYMKGNNYRGKIHDWEREHCEVDFGIDLMVTGAKMNCEGWSVYGNFEIGSLKYERSLDPVTWQTTGHSLTLTPGVNAEFEIGKIGGSLKGAVETTVKFDGNMNFQDVNIKGSVGAELSGPLGGKAGAEVNVGEIKISASGSFNSSGPSIPAPGFGSDFLK